MNAQTTWPSGDRATAELIRHTDWAATPLGPTTEWSLSLRATVDMLLACDFPMVVLWGKSLIQIYNDGYAEIMAAKHPRGMGQPTAECWPEVWAFNSPVYDQVLTGKTLTFEDQLFPITRHGYLEEAYFTLCYSPLRDERNEVTGVLVTVFERGGRQRFLLKLSDTLRPLRDVVEVQNAAMKMLGEELDVTGATCFEADVDQNTFHRTARYERDPTPIPETICLSDFSPGLAEAFRTSRTLTVRDAEMEAPTEAQRNAYRAIGVRAWAAMPLVKNSRLVSIVAVHSTRPRDWTASELHLLEDAAKRTLAAVERAPTEAPPRDSEDRQAFLLRLSDVLRTKSDETSIQSSAMQLLSDQLRITRAFYFTVEREDGHYVHVIEHEFRRSLTGPTMIGRHSLKNFGAWLFEGLTRGETVAVSDVAAVPGLKPGEVANYQAVGATAFVNVPLLRDGEYSAGITAHHSEAHLWTPSEISLLREVGNRVWEAVKRSEAERALRTSEKKFRTLFERMRQGYVLGEVTRDAQKRAVDLLYLQMNPEGARQVGVAVAEAIGKTARQVFPHLEDIWVETADRVVRERVDVRTEYELAASGQWFDVHWYPDEGDRYIVLFDDITERKRGELALRASEESFRLFVENVHEYALVQTNLNGIVTSWNPGAERLLGYGSAEIVGQPFARLLPEEDRHDGIIAREMALLSKSKKNESEHFFQRKDGSRFWCEWITEPVYDDVGQLRGTAKVMRDETERQSAETTIRNSLADKEELLKEVHHRVKNNLQVITSLLNLQASTVEDKNALSLFEEARNRVQSIASIHELLYRSASFASIGLRIYASQLLPRLIQFYRMQDRVRAQIIGDGQTIELERAVSFGLLLNELVSNALRHGFPDGRKGAISIDFSSEDSNTILRVADDGIGLPPEFDLTRAKSLGLKLVKVLIRQLRGEINTVPATGTIFEARFPAVDNRKHSRDKPG